MRSRVRHRTAKRGLGGVYISKPLTRDTVDRLREQGSHASADIAEDILDERERKARRWYRRAWRWLRAH